MGESFVGDKVYCKREGEKKWRRPAKLIVIYGKTAVIKHESGKQRSGNKEFTLQE